MSNKWQRTSSDIANLIYFNPKDTNLNFLRQRELGTYKTQFNFIQYWYYRMFPITTPRYIVISRNGDSYEHMELKFHSNCENGC